MDTGAPSARVSRAAPWFIASSAVLGLLALTGHAVGVELLTRIVPGRPAMQPITAVLMLLSALGIALRHGRGAGRARLLTSFGLGAIVLTVAVTVLVGYLFGVGTAPSLSHLSGPPSPYTAIAFVALGAAILLFDVNPADGIAPREWLCLTAVFVAFVSLVGHAFGAAALYAFGGSRVIGVALPTGVALGALGIGGLLERPEIGVMRLVTSGGPGGGLVRRLGLIAAIGGPLLGALLLVVVGALGVSDLPLILAIGAVLAVFFALSLLVATALPIERSHESAEAGRARVQELLDQAPEGIFLADLEGRYTEVNAAGCRLLGFSRDELVGKSIADLLRQEDVQRLWSSRGQQLEGVVDVGEWKLRRKDGTFASVEVTAKILPDGRWQGFVRDISERLELERKVLESRDFLQKVLESSTEYAIIAEDLEGRVVLWNEGARRNYGYELSEILNEPSDRLVAPTELAAWARLRASAMEHGTAEGTIMARRKDGAPFAAKVACTRRRGANGSAEGVLLVGREVTLEQRHLAEQEFLARVGMELASCLEYEETLTRVAQLATGFLGDVASIDVARDDVVRRARVLHREHGKASLAQAILGVGSARAEGTPLATVLETRQPLLLPRITTEDRNRFATSPEHARVLDAVGATSAMLVPLIARGQLLAILSVAACNGSRSYGPADLRLAEQLANRAALTIDNVQLFQQARLLGAMTANLADGVALVRASDETIVYANRRLEEMFGYEPAELIGRTVPALNAPDDVSGSKRAELLVGELARSGAWRGETRNVRKNGTAFWCALSVSAYEHEEYGKVWISVYSDITERKQLEQKNARALLDKEVLLREIHHRVKNNLQVISSLFSLQRERTDSEALKELLKESETRVQSIALVHEQLYRFTELAVIDLDRYLRSLVAAIRSSHGSDLVDIETRAEGIVLDGDQAVPCALLTTELISNSIKHAFGGRPGRIRVRAQRDAQGSCVLEVSDNGRGIPEDFDWRKARSLGLRLVQLLSRQLRGTVELDRSSGTCFRVKFPLRPAPEAIAAVPPPA